MAAINAGHTTVAGSESTWGWMLATYEVAVSPSFVRICQATYSVGWWWSPASPITIPQGLCSSKLASIAGLLKTIDFHAGEGARGEKGLEKGFRVLTLSRNAC